VNCYKCTHWQDQAKALGRWPIKRRNLSLDDDEPEIKVRRQLSLDDEPEIEIRKGRRTLS
jgi:hypothetical protein